VGVMQRSQITYRGGWRYGRDHFQVKGYDKMETRKTSISYSDYVRGIKFLNIDEQLTLLEIISARLKKSIGKKRKNSIMELEELGANRESGAVPGLEH